MMRRPLGQVVSEIAAAVQPEPGSHDGLRVQRLDVDLPIEVELRRDAGELTVFADLPRWRWRSFFDREPGRLTLALREEMRP